VAILVKEKDQSFKTIGFRSRFGHFPTEKSKVTPLINQGVQTKAATIFTLRLYTLFRGYGPEILTLGFYDFAKRRRTKELLIGSVPRSGVANDP
jgi:hypothetical protein